MIYLHSQLKKRGFSLVETLVAISVLLISIVAPLSIASRALQNNLVAQEQYIATTLAQEGIEAVVFLQTQSQLVAIDSGSDPWLWYAALPPACISASGCAMDFRDTDNTPVVVSTLNCAHSSSPCRVYFDAAAPRAQYSHVSSGTLTPYSRSIRVIDAGGATNQVIIESTVTWESPNAASTQQVTFRSALFDTAADSI